MTIIIPRDRPGFLRVHQYCISKKNSRIGKFDPTSILSVLYDVAEVGRPNTGCNSEIKT